MFTGFIEESIIKRAIEKGVVEVSLVDIREYSLDKHKHVDDTPCGGGAGMVMAVDVVDKLVAFLDFFVEGGKLRVGKFGVFLSFCQLGIETLYFRFELCFLLFELFF